MKVLVACEYSGIVRDAFIVEGHDAISCDLLPTERPGPHIQGDVREVLQRPWDLVIAHPPCTYLASSRGYPSEDDDAIWDALEFFIDCRNANAPRVAVENPQMYRFASGLIGKASQVVQPWQFGDMYLKRTYLWTEGLPPLLPQFAGSGMHLPSFTQKQRRARDWSLLPQGGHRTAKQRSKFHPGIAAAMAKQWGNC